MRVNIKIELRINVLGLDLYFRQIIISFRFQLNEIQN